MKFFGVISLRNERPTCAIPNGTFWRLVSWMWAKSTNMPCAVSGRSHTCAALSSVGPTNVRNIRLNARASVKSLAPQFVQ